MKKILSIILSITMLLSMGTVAFADGVDGPMQKAKLTVGINAEFAPFEYYEGEELKGFDIDLMNYIGERIGFDIEFVNMSFDKLIPAVVNGEVNCAISAITVTEERESVIDYTRTYLLGQTKIDGEPLYESYAIVFPDNYVQKAKLAAAAGQEFVFTLVNNAIYDLTSDSTVDKLIEKYGLNETSDETGYSNFTANKDDKNYAGVGPLVHGGRVVPTDEELKNAATTSSVPSEWAAKDIDYALAVGITENGKDYLYKENITREEFCELIYNLIVLTSDEITTPITDSFTDTKNDKILMLNGLGIINGKSATEFAPNDYLTREEAATIIIRMVNKVFPMEATEMWFEYDDISEISKWASDSVQTISNLGFMNGVGNNRFAPKDTYTTEQAIATLVRVYRGAETAGVIEQISDVGIIGGADKPAEIVVTDTIKVDDFYVDEAIKLINESGRLASDKDFISVYTTNDEMTEKVLALGAVDFNKPKDIYYLSADREQIIANIEALAKAEGVDIKDLGEHWFEHMWRKLNFSTLASMINASYGAENLAALTILTNSRGYIMPKDFKNNFALFVQYAGDYSAIISFSEFGDGVISANMSFVKNGDKDNVFMRMYEITSAVGEDGVEMAKVDR